MLERIDIMSKAIMLQGTMSNVGKSLLTAALCRIFRQDGYSAAPFKSWSVNVGAIEMAMVMTDFNDTFAAQD